jgi:hypothetical protein
MIDSGKFSSPSAVTRIEAIGRRVTAAPNMRNIVPLLLVLLLVLGQSAYWVGGTKWLAHALDHEKAGRALALDKHHDHAAPAGTAGDPEHNLLHEMEHVQLVPLTANPRRFLLDAALIAVVVLLPVARGGPERAFRPPRAVF